MRTIKFIIILLFSVVITNNVEAQILKKLKEAAQWMDISLLDHIIVCGDHYFSYADEGII